MIISFFVLVTFVNFSQSVYNIDEDKDQVKVMLLLSNPSTADIMVTVLSNDGSATGKNKCFHHSYVLCIFFY